MLSFGFRIFCWYRGFCHRTGSDLLLFLFIPLDGSVLKTLYDVDEEWQTKKRVRTYKAADDMRYTVSSDHFSQYCSTPRLDDNIEEGIMDSSRRNNPSGGKSHFKLSNKQLQTSDIALYKIDQEARLLLKFLTVLLFHLIWTMWCLTRIKLRL